MTQDTEPTDGQTAVAEREWWDDPALPWKHRPQRADLACVAWLGVASVYQLVMLPLRPAMLTLSPVLLGSLGYRTGLVMSGAIAATGDPWWPLVLTLGSLGAVKFDWIYWWAGKLWGHGLIEVWSGRSASARRRNDRAIRFAHRFESLAIASVYLPLPIPAPVVYAALGAAGTTLRKFLVVDTAAALVSTVAYVSLGWWLGAPAVEVVNRYGQWLWYVSLAILVGMLLGWGWEAWAKARAGASAEQAD